MKPSPFEYHAPTSLDEALDILGSVGAEGAPLAGGQSLVPLMNLRLARPAHVVDINRIGGLDTLEHESGRLRVGALVRHADMERSEVVRAQLPIAAGVVPFIGYPAIRHRGTVVGSLAHADPAAEWPCLALALDAEITLARSGSRRSIAASDFFMTMLTTVKEPDELLTEVSFRTDLASGGFYEFARRHGDFAIIAAVAALRLESGSIAEARIALAGAGDRPIRVREAEDAITGEPMTQEAVGRAAEIARDVVEPLEDIHGSSAYRKKLVEVAVERAMKKVLDGS
jgi:CO/xanthine dehydrogenase FAD-binding subunit